jgi:lipoyl(octanoyl) transferase
MAFEEAWDAMRDLTATRSADAPDEFWLLEHPSVYTLGLNGDPRHLLADTELPVIRTDRGGQITWHGPGQLVVYTLIDLNRRGIGIRRLVSSLETAVIGLLKTYGVTATALDHAPGVYVEGSKIASVGLRVKRGCSYHGLSFNVNPDLRHFSRINPCGHAGLGVTSLEQLGIVTTVDEVGTPLTTALMKSLGYSPDDLIA